MKKKRRFIISFSVVFLLIITLLFYLSTFIQPKITFNAQINKVSASDYKKIIDNTNIIFSDKSIDKFKSINLGIKIVTPFGIINRTHIVENETSQLFLLQKYLKENNRIQILNGNSTSQGNGMEYNENMDVYLKNISEDEFKSVLGNFRIKILWQDTWNNQNNKIFYFKDYLK